MTLYLTITVRLLDSRYHGRGDGGRPEWPPSPMRVFCALVAGNAPLDDRLTRALEWLETQPPPSILASNAPQANGVLSYVPSNNQKYVNRAADIKTGKLVKPVLPSDPAVTYVWRVSPTAIAEAEAIARTAGRLRCLGWGVDLAVAHGEVSDSPPEPLDDRRLHEPSDAGDAELRVPTCGSLATLEEAHRLALSRVQKKQIEDRPGVTRFARVGYGPAGGERRTWCAFALRDEDGENIAFPPNRLKHLAGMVRRAAAEAAAEAGRADDWVDQAILGHDRGLDVGRVSVLLLPTIGHPKSDGLVRRVLLQTPDAGTAEAFARSLNDRRLQAESPDLDISTPRLEIIRRRGALLDRYVGTGTTWVSTTPVLLPGHDVRRQDKNDHAKRLRRAESLLTKALREAGVEVPARLALGRVAFWSRLSHASRYEPREKYRHYPRYHARIEFDRPIAGPLHLGAGRHIGFGVMARCE